MSVPPSKISKNEETIVKKNWKNKKTRLQKSFNPISFLILSTSLKSIHFYDSVMHENEFTLGCTTIGKYYKIDQKSRVVVQKIVNEIVDKINHDVIERLTLF